MSDPLVLMAERARQEPYFFGHLLERYAQSEGLDDAALAARLGIAPQALLLLRLAGCPATEPARRRQDIQILADAHGIDPQILMCVVKHALALKHLQTLAPRSDFAREPGYLLAARDAEPHPSSAARDAEPHPSSADSPEDHDR
ncbi:MAG: hypothetical protein SNJ75_02365 [Gemmataceae bacterium]